MWLTRKAYQDQQDRITALEARVIAEVGANKAIRESNNWLMMRVTEMGKERAVLIERMFGVKIAVPELKAAPTLPDPFAETPFNVGLDFEDIGDNAAQQLGIAHDEWGKVVYNK